MRGGVGRAEAQDQGSHRAPCVHLPLPRRRVKHGRPGRGPRALNWLASQDIAPSTPVDCRPGAAAAAWQGHALVLQNRPMSAADFLLSPAVQRLLQVTYAEPTRQFPVAELSTRCKLDAAEVEVTLAHLLASGVLAAGVAPADAPSTCCANTAFVFYPELRRIALKSFAAAEPLRTMLRARFRRSVLRALLLGEDHATGALVLVIVYGEEAPDKAALDAALQKLLKTGAIRQHVQAHVMRDLQFDALRVGDALHAELASDLCVELVAAPARKRKPQPATAPLGLLEKARQRLRFLTT